MQDEGNQKNIAGENTPDFSFMDDGAQAPEGIPTQEEITARIVENNASNTNSSTDNNATPEEFKDIPSEYSNVSTPWKYLFNELSSETEKYKIPEEIVTGKKPDGTPLTERESYDILVREIQNSTEIAPSDVFVARYHAAKMKDPENFNYLNYLNQEKARVEVLGLPPDEYMFRIMNSQYGVTKDRPNGYSEEQIRAWVKNQDQITLEQKTKEFKTAYLKQLQEEDDQIINSFGLGRPDIDKIEEENMQIADKYLSTITNGDFSPIPFGDADRKEYIGEFKKLISRKTSDQVNAFEKFLQSDENFQKIAPIIWLQMKGKLPHVITDIKEQVKEQILSKLGILKKDYESGSAAKSGIDYDQLFS